MSVFIVPTKNVSGTSAENKSTHILSKDNTYQVCWVGEDCFTVWGLPKVLFPAEYIRIVQVSADGFVQEKLLRNAIDTRIKRTKRSVTIIGFAPIQPVKEKVMNTKQIGAEVYALAAKDFVTVRIVFSDFGKEYTYKAKAALNLAVGDKCVVDSPVNGLTVVTVTGVDDSPEVFNGYTYKWVVDKVSTTAHELQQSLEEDIGKQVEAAAKADRRANAVQQLLATAPEGSNRYLVLKDIVGKLAE